MTDAGFERVYIELDWYDGLRGGLAEVRWPAEAFFDFNWYSGRVDLLLECIAPEKLIPAPEFDRGQPKRQPVCGHRQAGMHQKSTDNGVL